MTTEKLFQSDMTAVRLAGDAESKIMNEETEYKYLEIEITRIQGTLVFLKVPKDFNLVASPNSREILKAAAVETCKESDWDSDQWEDTVEWQAIKEVPKAEAEAYAMYEVKP